MNKAKDLKVMDNKHTTQSDSLRNRKEQHGLKNTTSKFQEKDLKMKQKYIDDSDYIMKWWKPKAIKRYTKLFDEGKLKPEKLFYGDIVGKTWEETKEKYLGEVGR